MDHTGVKEGFLSHFSFYWDRIRDVFNLLTHAYHVLPAVTPALREEAFKVRHKVYCDELGYESAHSSGMEQDEYDHRSTQVVVYSRSHKTYVGCVRLVHGHHEGTILDLPFELHCKGLLDDRILTMVKESGHKYAEISRLAVEKGFRHAGRRKHHKHGHNHKHGGRQRKSSFALLSLYLGLQALARQQNIRYLFAIVEPRLLKNLQRHNVPAIQVGRGVDHRGLRVPILIDVEDVEKIIPAAMKPLYGLIHRDISQLLEPSTEKMPEGSPLSLREFVDPEFSGFLEASVAGKC